MVARKPSDALLVCVALAAVAALATLGERAFPWAIVLVAAVPWYPLVSYQAEGPAVRQEVLCAAIAAAPLLPWLWSLAVGGRRAPRPSRLSLLMGLLFAGLAALMFETLGSISEVIGESQEIGFLAGGVTFLCARRFASDRQWPAAAFGGLVALALLGAAAYLKAPSNRIGYFTGYPITYGALLVGLLPAALLFAYRRSRLLAGAVAGVSGALLIFSESRSSWVAVAVVLVVLVALQARAGNMRGLIALASAVAVLAALVLSTESLHHIVQQRLSSQIATSQSVTHREWSYGYALHAIRERPVFGAGAPGYSSQEAASQTGIGAIDNGYLSISVDLGLVGLFAALIPIGIGLRVLWRCLLLGLTPRYELALALGILGMAVVTAFYDSFYWPQIDLLLGAMGGVLSTRVAGLNAQAGVFARERRSRQRAGWAGGSSV